MLWRESAFMHAMEFPVWAALGLGLSPTGDVVPKGG